MNGVWFAHSQTPRDDDTIRLGGYFYKFLFLNSIRCKLCVHTYAMNMIYGTI